MAIRTIETVVDIQEDRRLIVQLPPDVPVGRHRVVTVLEETVEAAESPANGTPQPWTFPVLADAQWPADMPVTREEMYDNHGR